MSTRQRCEGSYIPVYDFKCEECGREDNDVYLHAVTKNIQCTCGGQMSHVWRASSVISDECDVWVKHGICNPDGSPRHYRFKSEMKKEAQRRGLENHVEHLPAPGSDKSKTTQRWV